MSSQRRYEWGENAIKTKMAYIYLTFAVLGASLWWLPNHFEHLPIFWNFHTLWISHSSWSQKLQRLPYSRAPNQGEPVFWLEHLRKHLVIQFWEADPWHDRCWEAIWSETSPGCGCVAPETGSPATIPETLEANTCWYTLLLVKLACAYSVICN